ncbi:MAG: tetratricopeptide repeat protein [Granulosicoccus sp.]
MSQLFTAIVFCALVAMLGVLHAMERWPTSNYMDAMASGQYERARGFLAPEVDAGNPRFQTALANLHYLGLGGETDFEKAAELYHKAASEGYGAAQLNLGHLYKQGLGVRKSNERAFGWYIHAKISDNPWADYYLSQLSVELTLSPLQMSTLKDRWHTLDALAAEPL